jgi:hypothetical protein
MNHIVILIMPDVKIEGRVPSSPELEGNYLSKIFSMALASLTHRSAYPDSG